MLQKHLAALRDVFRRTRDKFEAHRRAAPVMERIAADPSFIGDVLRLHLTREKTLDTLHYPVLAVDIELNADFGLVAHCWLPLPSRATTLSTKAIHHHGKLLLTTANLFGPGYEHWTFTYPLPVDRSEDLYVMERVARGQHAQGHVDFVPDHMPHVPMYVPDTSITLALWTNCSPTGWRDRLKRVPVVQRHAAALKNIAVRAGMTHALDLKLVENFDFFPSPEGFRGMRERQEFGRGPNEDYLHSLFHVIQKTGNQQLIPLVAARIEAQRPRSEALARALLADLESDRPIEPRLSSMHTGIAHANFTVADIERALAACAPRPSSTAHAALQQISAASQH